MPPTIPGKQARRVLVIAYAFPPVGGAGVQRVSKFVRYLPETGWDCSVLTVSNPSVPVFDESLTDEIPDGTVIRRAPTLEPGYAVKNVVSAGTDEKQRQFSPLRIVKNLLRSAGNAVLHPDPQVLWYWHAVRTGRQLLHELHHDAIFVTGPPFSSFLVGAALSRSSGLPLLLDYRDEWSISNRYQENRQKSGWAQWIQERQQSRVLRQAKAVVATTPRSAEALRLRVQECRSRADVTHIFNGYDRTDIPPERPTDEVTACEDSCYRIAYVGTLWNLTDISPLVKALRDLCCRQPELSAGIELIVAGRRTTEQDAILDQLNDLPCRLVRKGYLSHQEAIEVMQSSNELVLLLSDVPESARVMPAKTFEYLALRRNILSIAPPGEMTEILETCPYSTAFHPGDISGMSRHLEQRAGTGSSLRQVEADWEPLAFERRRLTEQLSDLLYAATDSVPAAAMTPPVEVETSGAGR